MRRELPIDAVEALEVVGAPGILGLEQAGRFTLVGAPLVRDSPTTSLGRRSHEYA